MRSWSALQRIEKERMLFQERSEKGLHTGGLKLILVLCNRVSKWKQQTIVGFNAFVLNAATKRTKTNTLIQVLFSMLSGKPQARAFFHIETMISVIETTPLSQWFVSCMGSYETCRYVVSTQGYVIALFFNHLWDGLKFVPTSAGIYNR